MQPEDDIYKLCEVFATMIENDTMTEEQCQETYVMASHRGKCHDCGRIGHFARGCRSGKKGGGRWFWRLRGKKEAEEVPKAAVNAN